MFSSCLTQTEDETVFRGNMKCNISAISLCNRSFEVLWNSPRSCKPSPLTLQPSIPAPHAWTIQGKGHATGCWIRRCIPLFPKPNQQPNPKTWLVLQTQFYKTWLVCKTQFYKLVLQIQTQTSFTGLSITIYYPPPWLLQYI